MKALDVVVDSTGKATVLAENGLLYETVKPGLEYANVPQHTRPEFLWAKVDAPPGKIAKLSVGFNNELWALIDGHLHRRVSISEPPFGRQRLVWQPVVIEDMAAPKAAAPAAPERVHIFEARPGAKSTFQVPPGSYRVVATSVVAVETLLPATTERKARWATVELINGVFKSDGSEMRISCGPDASRWVQVLKEPE